MSRLRSTTAKLIVSLFALLVLNISVLVSARDRATFFIALLTPVWHILANIYCAWIASYRFKDPSAKYIEIKNKYIRKILVRPCALEGVAFTGKNDNRTNIIGFVLNIINVVLLVLSELLLLLPMIPCETYRYSFVIGTRPRNYSALGFELHSVNEVIAAEASRGFAFATALILLVFAVLFERQLKEHRRRISRNTAKTPRQKAFKKTEWHSPLYKSLVDISVRQNDKKLKYWYNIDQLEQIESLVKSASENAEIKLETRGKRIVSFFVVDKLNNSVRFRGDFI